MNKLKFKKTISLKKLKNGEILFYDKKTGLWVKTSISFLEIGKLLIKGINSNDLNKLLENKYDIVKKQEIFNVIKFLRENDLLEDEIKRSKLYDVNRINFIKLLVDLNINKDHLFSFLYGNFKNKKMEIIFIDKRFRKIELQELNRFNDIIKTKRIKLKYRTNWKFLDELIIKYLFKIGFSEIQIDFSCFDNNKGNLEKKLKLLKGLISEGKQVRLNYDIVKYNLKKDKKENLLVPVFVIPHTSYYFTMESIFDSEVKRKDLYYKKYFSLVSRFYADSGGDGISALKYFPENSLGVTFFMPMKRNSCGAGKTFFYIDQNGKMYSCFYDTKSVGDIYNGIEKNFFINGKCKDCMFFRLCGGVCKLLAKNKYFNNVCKYNKKYFMNFFSNVNLDILKEVSDSDISINSERKTMKRIEKNIQTRILCPIGTF